MSLAQHVTLVEDLEYDGPANSTFHNHHNHSQEQTTLYIVEIPAKTDHHRPQWQGTTISVSEVEAEEPHTAAYKVTNTKRIIQVATAVVACWLASGIVFGFAALKPVLIAEGVYHELCTDTPADDKMPCAKQDVRLNLFFTVSSITANMSSLLAGAVLDRYGRRICWLASSLFLTIGCLLMGTSFAIDEFDGYMVANIFIALGGTFIFVPSFQLANAFPRYSGLVVALITGAFDASAAVYLFYRMAYEASGGSFSLAKFFFGYIIVPVLLLVAELIYMPSHAYHTMPELERKIENVQDGACHYIDSDEETSDSEHDALLRIGSRQHRRMTKLDQLESVAGDAGERETRVKVNEDRQEASAVWGALHGLPAHRQMLTPWFLLILALTVLQMLRMNYFIATVRTQYRYMLGSEHLAEAVNQFFDVALPIGGVASTPFIGLLLNNFSVSVNFGVLTILVLAVGVLNCLPWLWSGYATIVVFVVLRPLYYSAISDYATKVFGFATFGRIYGTIVCLSGIVNFSQTGLDALTHGPLNGDPTAINISMGGVGTLIGLALTVFVSLKSGATMEADATFVVNEKRGHHGEEDVERQVLLLGGRGDGYGTGL